MEKFILQCRCARHLRVPDTLLGRAVACSECGAVHRLIASGPVSAETSASPRQRVPFVGRLTIIRGPARLQETLFLGGEQPLLIGKIPGKNIILPGERVSRHHARLVLTGNTWWIEDLNSTNGIRVNNHRVASKALVHGDEVHIGDYDLLYLETFEGVNWKGKTDAPLLEPMTEQKSQVGPLGGIEELLGHNDHSSAAGAADLASTIAGESPSIHARSEQQSPYTGEGSTATDGLVPVEEIVPLQEDSSGSATSPGAGGLIALDPVEQQLRKAAGFDGPDQRRPPKPR